MTELAVIPGPPLPIDEALPRLSAMLREGTAAVLVAPPGAGKTTRVPLVLAGEPWAQAGRILVLEPRRLAARAAAERMATMLGERLGDTVGLRVRFESRVSARTRIEIITEGVFTRLIIDDPSLEGVAAVLFDEFHERSLDGDLGLALAREGQQGLREDLRLLVMSATLDGARVARLLENAPVVESHGRAFSVETRYAGRDPRMPIEREVAEVTARALRSEPGSALVFLPGAAEIRRTERFLRERLSDPAIDIVPLFGALDRATQDQAIAPTPAGRRKVVLATAIAETSITIEGVRIVVDSGLARVPRYEPDVGVTRLETVRVSRATADQRRGRAGRTEPGICIRLWDAPQTASLAPFARPEILAADLSGFMLDLAQWGTTEPTSLAFLDPPAAGAVTEAQDLLRTLGAIDADGRITEAGRRLRQFPLPPRLARMVTQAAALGAAGLAAEIAVLLTERGLGGNDVDLAHRLVDFRRDRSQRGAEARRMAGRWAALADTQSGRSESESEGDSGSHSDSGAILALAFPERIARNRGGQNGAFRLANGRGAQIDLASPLAQAPFLTIGELSGTAAQGRIVLAAAIDHETIEAQFADRIETVDEVVFDAGSRSLRGRRSRRLGALVLAEAPTSVSLSAEAARLLATGAAQTLEQLPWTRALRQWRDRVAFLRRHMGGDWPDLSDANLAGTVDEWLAPALQDKTALDQLSADEFAAALQALLPWNVRARLDAETPTHFEAPSGSRIPIDYAGGDEPTLSVRVQELFGLDRHPAVAGGRVPLVLHLLSPAQRPVQVTRDLPGFWRGSYAAVRSELRGRYPRHPWPEDPRAAPATRRAKPRGT